ncbi:putative heavy metal-associated domain, HMA, heavy metal-associated domain superfamily [Helianthus annuus]|nr:putative heavy metal-associated domain, HMA, heavy metal-associated domain superfamily [Helianthus annuus]
MHQRIELKVCMDCEKCKRNVLKSVAKLSGVDQVSADLEKHTLVVVGDVDPVCVVKSIRKTGKIVKIVTVGQLKKPDPPTPTKPVTIAYPHPTCEPINIPHLHPVCTDVYPRYIAYEQPYPCETGGCVIQ